MTRSVVLAGLLFTGALRAEAAGRPTGSALKQAIADFNAGNDDRALRELNALLRAGAVAEDAGRAHIYLGLIALNQLDSAYARSEFIQALSIDPTLELPFEASPKAGVLLEQARQAVNAKKAPPVLAPPTVAAPSLAQPPPTSAPEPTAASPVLNQILAQQPSPVESEPAVVVPESGSPSHVLSLCIGGAGLLTAGAGAVFLGLSAGSLSQARSDASYSASVSDALTSAHQQTDAEWLFAIGGGVVAIGVVVFAVEEMLGDRSTTAAIDKGVTAASEGVRF